MKQGLEKITTIGDAGMAAGGSPTPNTTHAIYIIKVELGDVRLYRRRKGPEDRSGSHLFRDPHRRSYRSGVRGIVGVKKFQYDIWGDTVNTASRMRLRPDLSGESSGQVGQVNISEATYQLVKEVNSEWSVVNGEQPIHQLPFTNLHSP